MTASSSSSRTLGGRLPFHSFASEEALEFLNDELSLLGIQTIDRIPTLSTSSSSDGRSRGDEGAIDVGVEQLLQTLFQLVELQRRNVVAINDMETEKRTSRGERDRLGRQLQQLQHQQATLKQSTVEAKEKERRAEVKAKDLAKMLNAEREEKKKLFQAMQYKEKQFVHESRKNEREMSRLKEHLQQVDKGDNILIPPKIEIINDLKRPGGRRRSTWSNLSSSLTKEEEALYSVVVANFGERQKQLLAENASLRQSLAQLKRKVEDVLGKEGTGDGGGEETEPALQLPFQLPFQLLSFSRVEEKLDRVRDTISEQEPSADQRLKSHLHIAMKADKTDDGIRPRDARVERERLAAKLEYYEETIERQAKMIERLAVKGNSFDTSQSPSSDVSSSLLSLASSSSSRSSGATTLSLVDIRRERESLVREKKEVADEALNLARERLRLREEHCRLVAPLESRTVGVQSVQSAAANPESSTNYIADDASDFTGSPKPSFFTDPLLANYLVDSGASAASTEVSNKTSSTGAAVVNAAAAAVTSSIASAPVTPFASTALSAATSSGRSTAVTSLTSLTRLGSSFDTTDDLGAYV